MAIIESGYLKGSFSGFKNRDTLFEFQNGGTWKQDEYHYHYFYAYNPHAKVYSEGGVNYIEIDGMGSRVSVKETR